MFINMFLFILNKPQRTPREKIIKKNHRFVLMTINTSKSGEIFKRGAKKCTPLKWRFEKMRGYRGEDKLLLHQKFVFSPKFLFINSFLADFQLNVFQLSKSLKHLYRGDFLYAEMFPSHCYMNRQD